MELITQKGIATIWLNNPEKFNAFNNETISELRDLIKQINEMPEETIVLLRGRGRAFCSGADLKWMYNAYELDEQANFEECHNLSQCLFELYNCKKTTIAIIHGVAYGGGIGLTLACDITICTDEAKLSFSELRMGIVAATICPYVFKKLGEARTKELIFTSRVFNGKDAESIGLVSHSVPETDLESYIAEITASIQQGDAKARNLSKELIHQVALGNIGISDVETTAHMLAKARVSVEARDRIGMFLK
jgi:methylglutaconyl-CoA hydratase